MEGQVLKNKKLFLLPLMSCEIFQIEAPGCIFIFYSESIKIKVCHILIIHPTCGNYIA